MKISMVAALALASVTIAGCATMIQDKENMLAAAGFQVRVADTPEKVASLKKLPANKFTVQNQNGNTVFIYADPTVCGCLYYGTQDNYSTYQQMVFQQRLATQQEMTAMMAQQAAFDFGPWGPGPWGPGPYGPGPWGPY